MSRFVLEERQMLDDSEKVESMHGALSAMAILAGEPGLIFYSTSLPVQAHVRGRVVLEDTIPVQFQVGLDSVRVNFHWEDAGYESYPDLGLYGYSDSHWVRVTCDGEFMHLHSDAYVLRVKLQA